MNQKLRRRAKRNRLLQGKVWKVFFFFQCTVLFYAHLYLFPFEMCCHDCGRVCVSIFAPCVDSDHHGYKFHTNRDGSPPAFLFPVFTLTFFSQRSVWNLSGSFRICRQTWSISAVGQRYSLWEASRGGTRLSQSLL